MSTEFQLYVYSQTGALVDILTNNALTNLSYGFGDCVPGVLEFTTTGGHVENLRGVDTIVEVRRISGSVATLEGDTGFFVRHIIRTNPNSDNSTIDVYTVTCYSAMELIRRRRVAYPAGSSYAEKVQMSWPTIMYEFMNENFGPGASYGSVNRSMYPWLTVNMAYDDPGASYSKSAPWENVLSTLQDIVQDVRQQGGMGSFDVVRVSPAHFEFRVFIGPRGGDHRRGGPAPLIVSQDVRNLIEPQFDDDWSDEVNAVYAAGQGQEDERVIVLATDQARATLSPFNLREGIADARQSSLVECVTAETYAGLSAGRPRRTFTGKISQTKDCIYQVHWSYGSLVTVEYGGLVFDCQVYSVQNTIADNGDESITGSLRSITDV